MQQQTKAPSFNSGINSRLIPLSKWPQYHAWPSISGMRHLMSNYKFKGIDSAVKRIGKKILVDEQSFFAWVEKQSTQQKDNVEVTNSSEER